ncbi:MAG: hypothetical protein EPN17_06115 [Methylobacter sp.]|nr:MAG: hypothetical protein EPN17_06115 [Methylobacter sp.]
MHNERPDPIAMGITGAARTACIADITNFNGSISTLLANLNQHSGRNFLMSEDEMHGVFDIIVPAKQTIANATKNNYQHKNMDIECVAS